MDGSQGLIAEGPPEGPLEPGQVRRFLADNPAFLRDDLGLLGELGLTVRAGNVLDFGPAVLARVHAEHRREATQRREIEETARANFAAQAQTHGAVVDLLEAVSLADLAARVDELARHRFGLAGGVVALETHGAAPDGWVSLVEGQVDMILGGPQRLARMGLAPTALGLFGELAPQVGSMAMVRMSIWEPAQEGLIAFASTDPDGFSADMGSELVAFMARVVERTAERWPAL